MPVTGPKPSWLRRRIPPVGSNAAVLETVKRHTLHTVCSEAHCPNQMECFGRGEAAFLLLGSSCTRRCTFCAVHKTNPEPADPNEPEQIAEAVKALNLEYCVLTMVTRDDLPDGGAKHIARTIKAVRRTNPDLGVEVLISDLGGDWEALDHILEAAPDVLNHNVETVPALYPKVRPQAGYSTSLELLSRVADQAPSIVSKSGLMLGLSETRAQVLEVLDDLSQAGCQLLTLGQYFAPSDQHHPVMAWVTPEEFEDYVREALDRGFLGVAGAPYVRSSYQAGALFRQAKSNLSGRRRLAFSTERFEHISDEKH